MIENAVMKFLRYTEGTRTPNLASVYRSVGRRFLAYAQTRGKWTLQDVYGTDFLREFLQFLEALRPRSAYSARNSGIAWLRDFFSYCIAAGWLPPGSNPAQRFSFEKRPRRPVVVLTPAEFARLLALAAPLPAALVVLLGRVGLKTGEAAALEWSSVAVDVPPYYLRIVSGPPSKRRVLPLDEETALTLRRARNEAPGGQTVVPMATLAGRIRFIQRTIRSLGQQAQISLTPQILRDTAAVHLLTRYPPLETARYLGYTPLGLGEFRQRYARFLPPDQET